MNKLEKLENKEKLIHWLLNRQILGLNGRPHKGFYLHNLF
jgi:prenyltransferase beta subunit